MAGFLVGVAVLGLLLIARRRRLDSPGLVRVVASFALTFALLAAMLVVGIRGLGHDTAGGAVIDMVLIALGAAGLAMLLYLAVATWRVAAGLDDPLDNRAAREVPMPRFSGRHQSRDEEE